MIYGQIAAANSLSDIYAMGGKPLSCLNLVGFPSGKLDNEVLEGIIAGALQKITEAGAVLLGGHTTEDDEPKFGLTVTGLVHPEKIWRNSGLQDGDHLILTKPIGSGVLLNANKKKLVSQNALQECIESMTKLNKTAAELMADFEIHAATDITGFGFAGHALEMVPGDELTMNFTLDKIPFFREASQMYLNGITTRVNKFNREMVEQHWSFPHESKFEQQELLLDPQTSGGLLFAVPGDQSASVISALHNAGITSSKQVGFVSKFKIAKLIFS
ncbi:uncharacterized protein METZ01_LOCUS67797 [marine metagenome]|uniref:PurM-like N-terminal domain-containing protein n=1 Tax=marine metagenome TaxID=408172 RepID=A0A381TLQ6_9ZZZZ